MLKALPLLVALLASPALAQDRVVVVEMGSSPNMMGMAAEITRKVTQAATRLGMPLVTPDEVRGTLGSPGMNQVQACEGQVTCVANRLRPFAAQRAWVGQLGRDERHYLLQMWLIDLKQMQVVAEVDRKVLIAARRLMTEVDQLAPRILQGQGDLRGTIEVVTNVPGVEVQLAGTPVGVTPLKLELKSGKHELQLSKDGYLPVERLVTVEGEQHTVEEIRMISIGNELPPVLETKNTPSPLHVPVGAWVATGAAAAAAGVGVYFGVSALNAQRRLSAGYNPDTGEYQGTRRQALEAQEHALYANLSFGVAGAAAVTAVVLTVLGQPAGGSVQVTPAVSSGGGGALVRGNF